MRHLSYSLQYYLALIDNEADQLKFEELYHKYKKRMYYTAKDYLKDEFLAEDVVHEALCKIARNMDKLYGKPENEIEGFVMLVAKRASIDAYRKRRLYFDKEIYDDRTDDEDDNTNSFLERHAPAVEMPDVPGFEGSDVGRAILSLGDEAKNVFLLKYSYGYDNRDISEITGFSVAKIEKLLSRSKKKLRESLANTKKDDA